MSAAAEVRAAREAAWRAQAAMAVARSIHGADYTGDATIKFDPAAPGAGPQISADDSTVVVIDIARRIGQAPRVKEIDALGSYIWTGVANGAITESAAKALDCMRQHRRDEQLAKWEHWQRRYGLRARADDDPRPADERRAERLLRNRKRLAQRRSIWRLGWVPNVIANGLTPGEEAVAAIYAEDMHRKGCCDDSKAQLAERAGVCERVVVRAQKKLAEARAINVRQRERKRHRHDTTIVRIINGTWLLGCANARSSRIGGRVTAQNRNGESVPRYLIYLIKLYMLRLRKGLSEGCHGRGWGQDTEA